MAAGFTEWLAEYKKLESGLTGIPLVNIKEVLSVGGKHFVLSLGKENEVKDEDQTIDPKNMRPFYTGHRDEFSDVLEILQDRAKEQREFAINVVNALVEQAVPEAVMARMTGEQVSGDAFEMLKFGTRKKLDELVEIASAFQSPFQSFHISVEVAGRKLTLIMSEGKDFYSVGWGDITVSGLHLSKEVKYDEATLEDDMFFLTNFEFIRQALIDLGGRLAKV